MARLSRWMAGKAVGLVLSGGGSRGLAHLGVLHALDDAGIPVDVIGGTSQGAFMAALYAQVAVLYCSLHSLCTMDDAMVSRARCSSTCFPARACCRAHHCLFETLPAMMPAHIVNVSKQSACAASLPKPVSVYVARTGCITLHHSLGPTARHLPEYCLWPDCVLCTGLELGPHAHHGADVQQADGQHPPPAV